MRSTDLVKLTPLMKLTEGKPSVLIGLIDGPVAIDHPYLTHTNIREIPGWIRGICAMGNSTACTHGTFVAGVLLAKRNSAAPAICPGCHLLVRPIFPEALPIQQQMPSATSEELANAIVDCISAGVHIINLSAALANVLSVNTGELEKALDAAARQKVIIVAAAGNQRMTGSTIITRHPWVIPIVASDLSGRPLDYSNLGHAIGRHGLSAPGEQITSTSPNGQFFTFSGTSAATPFVTGAIALLWSEFPNASAADVKLAVLSANCSRRMTVVPPLLDAWGAYQMLKARFNRRNNDKRYAKK